MNALLQQAQQMQEQLVERPGSELAEADGRRHGRRRPVTVTVNGTGELVGVQIRAGCVRRPTPTTCPTSAT